MIQSKQKEISILRNTFLLIASQICITINLLLLMYFSGKISPKDFSIISFVISVLVIPKDFLGGSILNYIPIISGVRNRNFSVIKKLFISLLISSIIFSISMIILFPLIFKFIMCFGINNQDIIESSLIYLKLFIYYHPALAIFYLLKSFFEGFSILKTSLTVNILGIFFNFILSYLLINNYINSYYGNSSLSGLITIYISIHIFMAISYIFIFIIKHKTINKNTIVNKKEIKSIEIEEVKKYLKIGTLNGLTATIDAILGMIITSFLLKINEPIAFLIYQIAYQVDGLLSLLPLSFGTACMIDWSKLLANKANKKQLFYYLNKYIKLALLIGIFNMLVLIYFRDTIINLFISDNYTKAACRKNLLFCAFLQVPEALFIVFLSILKVFQQAKYLLILYLISYFCFIAPMSISIFYLFMEINKVENFLNIFWFIFIITLSIMAFITYNRVVKIINKNVPLSLT